MAKVEEKNSDEEDEKAVPALGKTKNLTAKAKDLRRPNPFLQMRAYGGT